MIFYFLCFILLCFNWFTYSFLLLHNLLNNPIISRSSINFPKKNSFLLIFQITFDILCFNMKNCIIMFGHCNIAINLPLLSTLRGPSEWSYRNRTIFFSFFELYSTYIKLYHYFTDNKVTMRLTGLTFNITNSWSQIMFSSPYIIFHNNNQ